MPRAALWSLACLCLGLAGVLGWELQGPIVAAKPERVPAMITAGWPAAEPAGSAESTKVMLAQILARPLFSETRRPAREPPAHSADAVAAHPRLAGVIVGPAGMLAIFADEAGGPIVARMGDQIGSYRVKSISAGQVTIESAAGEENLRPTFASALPRSATQPGLQSGPVSAPLPGLPRPRELPPSFRRGQ